MARPADKTALVVAVARYSQQPLANPVNDARDMMNGLRKSGFRVIYCIDPDRAALIKSVHDFNSMLPASTMAVFFYSGHGGVCKKNGQHYMLTREWDGRGSDDALEVAGYPVEEVVGVMKEKRSHRNLVILDACRVFLQGKAPSEPTHGWGRSMSTSANFLVCHACENLTSAYGGTAGGNSTYTKHLLKHLFTDTPIHLAISRANTAVMEESHEQQNPLMQVCDLEAFMDPLSSPGTSGGTNNNVDAHVWNTVRCDGCGLHPIIGLRFRCQDCPAPTGACGYDLCWECKSSDIETKTHLKEHVMALVDPTVPVQPPPPAFPGQRVAVPPVVNATNANATSPRARSGCCWC